MLRVSVSLYNLQRDRDRKREREREKQQKHSQPHAELTILGDTTAKLALIIYNTDL